MTDLKKKINTEGVQVEEDMMTIDDKLQLKEEEIVQAQDIPIPKVGDYFKMNKKGHIGEVIKILHNGMILVDIEDEEKEYFISDLYNQIDHRKKWFRAKIRPVGKNEKESKKGKGRIKGKKVKQKYNRAQIKAEFMRSQYISVPPFLRNYYNIDIVTNAHAYQQTRYWKKEKLKIEEELRDEAIEKYKAEKREKWDRVMGKIDMAHLEGLENLADKVLDQGMFIKKTRKIKLQDVKTGEIYDSYEVVNTFENEQLDSTRLIGIINHFKTEKGEATSIIENKSGSIMDYVNDAEEITDSLDEEDTEE